MTPYLISIQCIRFNYQINTPGVNINITGFSITFLVVRYEIIIK